jgi:hypothetical protein
VLEAVQFKQRDNVEDLLTQIDKLNVKPAMLFIDTFATPTDLFTFAQLCSSRVAE